MSRTPKKKVVVELPEWLFEQVEEFSKNKFKISRNRFLVRAIHQYCDNIILKRI